MTDYAKFTEAEMNNHLSNFLVDTWSYSRVSQFARNPAVFEMRYIYGHRDKSSATTIAGQAYHYALDRYFTCVKQSAPVYDIADMQQFGFEYIEDKPAFIWKLQKTTPTMEEAIKKAVTVTNALLVNFMAEIGTYMDEIESVIDVEFKDKVFIDINGVSIPIPLIFQIDLVVNTKDGKVVIIDHKSKTAFSDEQEAKFVNGLQAITYAKGYEAATGIKVDEVWIIENKSSKNKNGDKQLQRFVIELDDNTRKLYEFLLYEPLRGMISAVNDPDYVYIINNSDAFIDKAEIYEFKAKTMIAEVEEFNVDPSKRQLIEKRLKKIRDASMASINPSLIKKFRENAAVFIQYNLQNKNMTNKEKIEHVLRTFGIITQVAHEFSGYSSNTYLLSVQAGVKISSIKSHALDIANALDVERVRIANDLAVHEGKSYVAIEHAKHQSGILLYDESLVVGSKLPIGKDNYGNVIVWDLDNQSTPHALVCGATGSGKSVFVKTIIESAKHAGWNVIILDPKYEFGGYSNVYQDILEIEQVMEEMVNLMNELVSSNQKTRTLIIFEEFGDAVANSRKGKELVKKEMQVVGNYADGSEKEALVVTGQYKSLEENLKIILQKGRSSGLRVMCVTQRASTKIITGDAKANLPVQICFRVPKTVDSMVVIDEAGAETLAGNGDGLIKSPQYMQTTRFQGFYKP